MIRFLKSLHAYYKIHKAQKRLEKRLQKALDEMVEYEADIEIDLDRPLFTVHPRPKEKQ